MSNLQLRPPAAGPFRGLAIPAEEISSRTGLDQKIYEVWEAKHRTAHVLDRFPPVDGFAITIEQQDSPHRFLRDVNGEQVAFPAILFVATLLHKGLVLAQASHCETITAPTSYAWGENGARNRLYEALGLSGGVSYTDEVDTAATTAASAKEAASTSEPDPEPEANPMANVTSISVDEARARERTPRRRTKAKAEDAPVNDDPATSEPEAKGESEAAPDEAVISETAAVDTTPDVAEPDTSGEVKAVTQRQAQIWAGRRGVALPVFASQRQAADFVKSLMRGGAG